MRVILTQEIQICIYEEYIIYVMFYCFVHIFNIKKSFEKRKKKYTQKKIINNFLKKNKFYLNINL